LGLFFLILGAKLDLINAFGSDVPFWDPWGLEGGLFIPALEGRLDPSLLFRSYGEHNVLVSRLLALMLLKLNGQWDPIVELVVNSLIYSLILTGLCLILWRLAGRKNLPLFCLMIAISGVLHFGWENTVSTFQSCFYFLLGFSLLAIVLLVCSKPFSVPWFLGLVAALLGQFSLGTGFFPPVVVACVLFINSISGAQRLKESAPAAVALVAASILIFVLVPSGHASLQNGGPMNLFGVCVRAIAFLKQFAKVAAWPFHDGVFAAVLWLPFFILIWKQFRAKGTSTLAQFLLALGIWTLLHAAAIVWSRMSIGLEFAPRYKDILIAGLWINLIITSYLLRAYVSLLDRPASQRAVVWLGATLLALCTGMSALHLNTSDIWTQYYKDIQEVNTARYVLTGDPSSLVNQPLYHIPMPSEFAEALIKALDNQTLRKILPACIRAPLPLELAENQGFSAEGIPSGLPPLTHRKVLGSWKADKGPAVSEYLSQPVSSGFGWLVLDIAGGGLGTSLEILPSQGPAVRVDVGQLGRGWRKVMVKTPKGPFRLRATDRSEQSYIAFSMPRELAAGGYYTRWILSKNYLVLLLGMVCLLAGLKITLSKESLPLEGSGNLVSPGIF
jgi:hypothetical protein